MLQILNVVTVSEICCRGKGIDSLGEEKLLRAISSVQQMYFNGGATISLHQPGIMKVTVGRKQKLNSKKLPEKSGQIIFVHFSDIVIIAM